MTGQARRVHRVLLGRPERDGDRLRHPLDAHPQVHRRLQPRALAGLRLRRRVQGRARSGPHQRPDITWGDTHHPALSETNGDYDGQFLFINDKANPRLAVIDLHDFETKQIVVNPIFQNEHGGAFVSENTEYVMEAAQLRRSPRRRVRAPRALQREVPRRRHLLEVRSREGAGSTEQVLLHRAAPLQPGSLGLRQGSELRAGPSPTPSAASATWAASSAAARLRGRLLRQGHRLPARHQLEEGAQVVKAGKTKKINGHTVIPMEHGHRIRGLVYLIPEPKSPHGVDVTPDGKYIVISASSTATPTSTAGTRSRRRSRTRTSRARIPTDSRSST